MGLSDFNERVTRWATSPPSGTTIEYFEAVAPVDDPSAASLPAGLRDYYHHNGGLRVRWRAERELVEPPRRPSQKARKPRTESVGGMLAIRPIYRLLDRAWSEPLRRRGDPPAIRALMAEACCLDDAAEADVFVGVDVVHDGRPAVLRRGEEVLPMRLTAGEYLLDAALLRGIYYWQYAFCDSVDRVSLKTLAQTRAALPWIGSVDLSPWRDRLHPSLVDLA